MRPETTFTGPDLCARLAREVVAELAAGHLEPGDVLDACAARMEQVEGDVNAVVTRCVDRAREAIGGLPDRARAHGAAAGWLAGLPVAIKDLNPVAGVRTTYANTWYADFVPEASDETTYVFRRGAPSASGGSAGASAKASKKRAAAADEDDEAEAATAEKTKKSATRRKK